MLRLVSLLIAMLVVTPAVAENITSSYTKFDLEKTCDRIDGAEPGSEEEEQGGIWQCKGFEDFPILFKYGDLRESVQFGKLKPTLVNEAWESFGNWNRVNTTVEWRLLDGKPFAAIIRFFLDIPDDNGGFKRGQVLVVNKVATEANGGNGCMVGAVDARANKDANVMAREVADTRARGHDCFLDPQFYGNVGETAGDISRSFPG